MNTSETGSCAPAELADLATEVQTAVKLKKKLFVGHQYRVGDSVSGKVIGNVIADQGNAY